MSEKVKSSDNLTGGDKILGDGTVMCDGLSDYCFSYWQIEPTNGTEAWDRNAPTEAPGFGWLARGKLIPNHLFY